MYIGFHWWALLNWLLKISNLFFAVLMLILSVEMGKVDGVNPKSWLSSWLVSIGISNHIQNEIFFSVAACPEE